MYSPRVAAATAATAFILIAGARLADAREQTGPTAVDPDAIAALEKMGAYLRTLKAFQVQAKVTTEEVMTDGQKVQSTSDINLLAARPNRLREEIVNDRQPRVFYYDGKSFTLYAPRLAFYASVDAPPTIGELATRLEDRYDIDLPFVDLFRWGTAEGNTDAITSAVDLGASVVEGVTCEQYAFRQAGLDWQLWVQQGDNPLPRKVVLSTLTDESRPQHAAVYTWNLAPSFNDAAFAFDPPESARKIVLAESRIAAAVVAKQGGSNVKP